VANQQLDQVKTRIVIARVGGQGLLQRGAGAVLVARLQVLMRTLTW